MAPSDSKTNNWLYRASDEEHDVILEAVRKGRYPSIASFVREACLRLAHEDDLRPMISQLYDMTEELQGDLHTLAQMLKEAQNDQDTEH